MRSIECLRESEYEEPWTCSSSSLRVFVSGSSCLNESFEVCRLTHTICFHEAALCLARSTTERKLTEIGAQSIKTMTQLVECSEWNFRNKLHLLNAELHYLESRNSLAEISFKAAIASAHEHRFYHEEALACELYGIFLIETSNLASGIEQLQLAIDKYVHWGAKKKADDVKDFIVLSTQSIDSALPYQGQLHSSYATMLPKRGSPTV